MRTYLENILPSGAPWGGPESVSFLSKFVSMLMEIRQYKEDDPSVTLYCVEGPNPCIRCAKCQNFNWNEHLHEQLYHQYLTLSGIAFLTQWPSDAPLVITNECIARIMDFAGLNYLDTNETTFESIKASIDEGRPVLLTDSKGIDWTLIAGYDTTSDVQILLDEHAAPHPFPESSPRALIITGFKPPRNGYAEEFSYQADILKTGAGFLKSSESGFSAYDALFNTLNNNPYFDQTDDASLLKLYQNIHNFVGMEAERRFFIADTLTKHYYGLDTLGQGANNLLWLIGAIYMQTHDTCWHTWRLLGNPDLKYAADNAPLLRSLSVRQSILQDIKTFQKYDTLVYHLLKDAPTASWLMPLA
ncbi:MAG: hypothetical protein E7256_07905 [Lachnospiraceae bacterium]|nr:hypothetical protein [Lachnospiraceae bacterium]